MSTDNILQKSFTLIEMLNRMGYSKKRFKGLLTYSYAKWEVIKNITSRVYYSNTFSLELVKFNGFKTEKVTYTYTIIFTESSSQ